MKPEIRVIEIEIPEEAIEPFLELMAAMELEDKHPGDPQIKQWREDCESVLRDIIVKFHERTHSEGD